MAVVCYNYELYIHPMEFEWDDTKNRANIRKHGVSFETASRIFERSRQTRRDGRRDYGEDRYITVGAVDAVAVIVVAHTEREGRIRLISARRASRKEREAWHERIQEPI